MIGMKDGGIISEGERKDVLREENVGEIYDVWVRIKEDGERGM